MKDFADKAANWLEMRRVDYGDIRVVCTTDESITVKTGRPEGLSRSTSRGFGVRVLVDGAWGFAASSRLEAAEMKSVIDAAIRIAKASAGVRGKPVELAPTEPVTAAYQTPHRINPLDVSLEEKLQLLYAADEVLRKNPAVTIARGFLSACRTEKVFASTEGARIEQDIIESGGGIAVHAIREGEVQVRSHPNSFRGNFATAGYEYVESLQLVENAERIAVEAEQLLSAPVCPARKTTLILDGGQLALQVHESVGHPIELDRVLGSEASYAGTSFLTLDKRNELRYGSEVVNIVADATAPGGLGTFGYDDEGVPAQRAEIIRHGKFVDYLTSRETAPEIGQRSNGTMRADGWDRIPLIRMTNINLLPGEWDLNDLIADTDDGIYMMTNRSWSIDDKRLNFQFGTEFAREIKGGRLGRVLRNPTYTGITPEFWNSCDAICNPQHWMLWGTPNCGKGQPAQAAHVGHGVAPARFRNVQVGVLRE